MWSSSKWKLSTNGVVLSEPRIRNQLKTAVDRGEHAGEFRADEDSVRVLGIPVDHPRLDPARVVVVVEAELAVVRDERSELRVDLPGVAAVDGLLHLVLCRRPRRSQVQWVVGVDPDHEREVELEAGDADVVQRLAAGAARPSLMIALGLIGPAIFLSFHTLLPVLTPK